MTPSIPTTYLLVVMVIVSAIGTVDAGISGEWDLFALFASLGVLLAVLLGSTRGHRPAVPLRADLVGWLRARAEVTGESLEVLADRAVACYRQGTDPIFSHRHSPKPTERPAPEESIPG